MTSPINRLPPAPKKESPQEPRPKYYFHHLFGETTVFFTVLDSVPEGKSDPQSKYLNPANAIDYFEKALNFLKTQGLSLPSSLNVSFGFYPGSGSDQRSSVSVMGDVFFDMEGHIEMATVVHELVHVATLVLGNMGGEYTYLAEGFANYMEERYTGVPPPLTRTSINWSLSADQFTRSGGSFMTQAEMTCYRVGYEIWKKIERKKGEAAVFALIRDLEAIGQPEVYWEGKKELLDSRVEELTGKATKKWIDSQLKKTAQENFGLLNGLDVDTYVSHENIWEEMGVSLAPLGPFRTYVRFGVRLLSFDGDLLEASAVNAGLSLKVPPLFPMRWNSQGFRLGEGELEFGATVALKPYARADLTLLSYGRTTRAEEAMRAGLGGSVMVYDNELLFSGLLGVEILF